MHVRELEKHGTILIYIIMTAVYDYFFPVLRAIINVTFCKKRNTKVSLLF